MRRSTSSCGTITSATRNCAAPSPSGITATGYARKPASTSAEHQLRGTVVHDEVQYEMRLGMLGELGNRAFMRRQMRSIFKYRQKRTAELIAQMLPRVGIAL